MAINTQKFLPSSKGGALTKVPKAISKNSSGALVSENTQKNIGIVHVKIIEIDKILKGTLASKKKELDDKKRETSQKRRENIETKLETKPSAEKGKIEMPKAPRMGFLDWIKNFIGNIILGYFAVRLVKYLPLMMPIVKFLGNAADFVIDIGGKLLDGLVTFVDWGYKAYDATRGFMKNLFGDGGVQQFEQLSSLLNKFLNLALIAGMVAASSGGLGKGAKGSGARPRPGQGGRPKVTASGGGRSGGIDIRNPLRRRPKVTVGGGGNKALLSSVRPFLKRIPLPVIGALIDFGLSVALGENPGRAAFRAIGAGLLGAVGAAAGSVVPVAGTFIGGLLGGVAGDAIGGVLFDAFFGGKSLPKGKAAKKAGGGITRGGKSQGGVRRTVSSGNKGKYKRKLSPKKPEEVQLEPGADVGGEEKIFGLFPKPKLPGFMNPFGIIESTGKEMGKSDYFGPILAITSKILLGQKPTQRDYENVGLGINLLISKGINEGKLKGGLAAAFAEGGLVDPQALSAVKDGGDISEWVAASFKDATESNAQKTLREIQENLRLQKEGGGPQGKPTEDEMPTGTGSLTGNTNAEKVFNFLKGAGFTDQAAAGVIGNLMQESGVNPKSRQLGGGPGRGIMQWGTGPGSGGRWDALVAWAAGSGKDPWALDTQVEWMMKEMRSYGTFNRLKGVTDVKKAVQIFESEMEKAGVPNYPRRYQFAADALASFGGGKAGGGIGSSRMDRGGVGGSVAEYITGDPNTPFGRYDRGGHGLPSNYHDHIAFRDRNTAVNAYKFFKSKGIQVTEFKGFDPVGGHASGSYHYSGLAFDIPGAQWGGSGAIGARDYAGSAKVRKTLKEFLGGTVKLEKGGPTLNSPHLAIVGEKGTEFVIDADSTAAIEGTFPGFLSAINKAKYEDAINVLRNFASYEAGSEQTIIMPEISVNNMSDGSDYASGSSSLMMSGGDETDPFDSLYMGG
jgi:hypothetical protein